MRDGTIKAIIAMLTVLLAYFVYMTSPYAGDGITFSSVIAVLAGLGGFIWGRKGNP